MTKETSKGAASAAGRVLSNADEVLKWIEDAKSAAASALGQREVDSSIQQQAALALMRSALSRIAEEEGESVFCWKRLAVVREKARKAVAEADRILNDM